MKIGTRVVVHVPWSEMNGLEGTIVEVMDPDVDGHVVKIKLDDYPRQYLRFGVESLRAIQEPEPHVVAGE